MSIQNVFFKKEASSSWCFCAEYSSSLATQAIMSANNEVEKSQTSTSGTHITRLVYSATQRASIEKKPRYSWPYGCL